MVEPGRERPDAGGRGAQLDDEIADLRFRDHGAEHVPSRASRAARRSRGSARAVPVTRPVALDSASDGIAISTDSTGSSSTGLRLRQGLRQREPAPPPGRPHPRNRPCDRSRPSGVTARSTTGKPSGPRLSASRTPVSTEGMYWRGTTPPVILSSEGEALAARQRLDLDHHVAELAVAAGLLLVPAARRRGQLDRLAIADLRLGRLDADLEAEASRSTATRRCISPCPSSRISPISGRVSTTSARVLLGDLGERAREPHVVLAVLHPDGERIDRLRRRHRGDRVRAAPCRPRSCRRCAMPSSRAKPTVSPSSASGIARRAAADQRQQARRCAPRRRASRPPCRPRGTCRARRGPRRACRPAPVCSVFITCASGGPLSGTPSRAAGLGERRRLVAQRLEKPRDAVAALGRADQHRHHVALPAARGRDRRRSGRAAARSREISSSISSSS